MAILVAHSFGTGANLGQMGIAVYGGTTTYTTGGRYGGGYVNQGYGYGQETRFPFPIRTKVGFHLSVKDVIYESQLALWYSGAQLLQFSFDAFHHLTVVGPGNTLLGTTDTVFTPGYWYGLEVWVEFSATVGKVKVWVNGSSVPEITLTGLNIGAQGADNLYYRSGKICDLVVYDDQGGVNDTAPLGDLRVDVIVPDDNGNSSQWVNEGADSVDNYQSVDDVPYDTNTYVESSTVGDKDTYHMGDVPISSGAILAVQGRLMAKKMDAGTREIAAVYRLSTTEVDGATKTLGSDWLSYPDLQETKPGGGAWTISDVNAMEFGQKVIT